MGSTHQFTVAGHACEVEIRLEGSLLSPFMQFYTYRLLVEGEQLFRVVNRDSRKVASTKPSPDTGAMFQQACATAAAVQDLGEENALILHSLYQQATRGNCRSEPPSLLRFQEHMEWQAWKMCEGVPQDDAKLAYVAELNRLIAREAE
jgi:diazepam-binding inhibitor (GABA receptor modulating acyl-CoA-binding protein)